MLVCVRRQIPPVERISFRAPDSQRMKDGVEKLLERVHASSGSLITANSRRMRTLRTDAAALAQCRSDVEKDIKNYGHVSIETKAMCVNDYAKQAEVQMSVCGACGIRDPFDTYGGTAKDPGANKHEVTLADIATDHWLEVGKDAYARLKACPDIEMLRGDGNGGYESLRIPRTDLHSLVEIGARTYHVVPEALLGGQKVRLCKRCSRGWNKNVKAKRTNPSVGATNDNFEDMYASNAPAFSIARGADFGRLSALRSKGIQVDVSTLERLLLAETRCHHIVYKVVAYGEETDRQRLHGHSIVCPHKAVGIDHNGFGKAALEAAYASVRILFVGPNGMRTKLEQAALKIEDLGLRPDVIFNQLSINHVLHNGPPVPDINEIVQLIKEHSLAHHIKQHASYMTDTAVEEATTPSDVANVRSHAQAANSRNDVDDPEADQVAEGEALPPSLVPIGLFELEPQQMDALLKGIERLVIEGDGGNADDNPHVVPAIPDTTARSISLQREDRICSDYNEAPDVLYKAWGPLMPLRRGFVNGKSIPDGKWRQVFLYFDNRFAHDLALLFHVANMLMRHAVNRAVNAKVMTRPEAFEEFKKILHDGEFLENLNAARDDPQGPTAREVVSRVMPFINLSSKSVPWGSGERASEMSKLIADHRYAGPSSMFISVAPDDVHNATAIRMGTPYTGENTFPALVPPEFLAALRGQEPSERTASSADGSITYAMDETSLQLFAAKNPVACAITFNHLIANVNTNLLGLSNGRLKDTLFAERDSGFQS